MISLDLSKIIGGFPDPMLLVEPDGTIIAANSRTSEFFQHPARALVGKRLSGLLADEDDSLSRYLRMCRRTSEAIPGRLRIRLPDGQVLPCKADGRSLRQDGRGDPVIWLRLLSQQSAFGSFSVLNERLRALSASESARVERKRAAEELRQSEERFRLLVESIQDYAIFMLDLEGHVASWNWGAERIKGYRAEEILGRHYSIFYPADDVDRGIPDAQLREAFLHSRAVEEGWRIRKDGSRFWANGSLASIRNGDGNVIGFAKITRDLTERKRHEEALRESEARTRLILDTALDAVMTIDEHGIVKEWNPQAERIFGWRYGEAVDRRISELLIPPRYRTAHENGLRHFLATGGGSFLNRRVEISAVRRDGSEFPVELSVVPYRIGEAWLFSGFVRDITERKRGEEALRASEGRWRRIFENSAIGIALTNRDGRFEITNSAYQKLIRYTEDELLNMTFLDVTVSNFQAQNWALVTGLLEGKREQFNIEKQYRCKDGSLIWARNNVSLVLGSDGAPRYIMAIVEDITKRKRAEEAPREAELELARVSRLTTMGEVAASIAHELRQPLSAAVTNGTTCQHWLSEDTLDLAIARRAAQRTIAAAQRASEVMDRIRALLNKTPPERARVAINNLLRETLAVMDTELRARRIVVATELAEPSPSTIDWVELQQVVLNLIMNGVEAMSVVADRPRLLRISSRREAPDSVLVAVEDSGTGLDPAIAERMFDPFFTTKGGGMGIGLAICRSIIDGHGGRLWAAPAPPHGALVQFTLPTEDSMP